MSELVALDHVFGLGSGVFSGALHGVGSVAGSFASSSGGTVNGFASSSSSVASGFAGGFGSAFSSFSGIASHFGGTIDGVASHFTGGFSVGFSVGSHGVNGFTSLFGGFGARSEAQSRSGNGGGKNDLTHNGIPFFSCLNRAFPYMERAKVELTDPRLCDS